jgi:peptide deformylase
MNTQNEITDINDDEIVLYDTKDSFKTTKSTESEIETFQLVHYSHEAMSKVLPEFDFENAIVNPTSFASSLVETCKKYNGYGLSANQCGFEHRVFVMGAGDQYVAYFNPKILAVSEETIHMAEACLSFPMLTLNITRPKSIEIEYQDHLGEKHTTKFTGMTARCFLHELDHMNGLCYTSRVKPLALKQGLKKVDKQRERFSRQLKNYMSATKPKHTPVAETNLNTAQQMWAQFKNNDTKETTT